MSALQQTDLLGCKVSQPAESGHRVSPAHRSTHGLQRGGGPGRALAAAETFTSPSAKFRKSALGASYKYNVKKSVRHTRMHAVFTHVCKL